MSNAYSEVVQHEKAIQLRMKKNYLM